MLHVNLGDVINCSAMAYPEVEVYEWRSLNMIDYVPGQNLLINEGMLLPDEAEDDMIRTYICYCHNLINGQTNSAEREVTFIIGMYLC